MRIRSSVFLIAIVAGVGEISTIYSGGEPAASWVDVAVTRQRGLFWALGLSQGPA